MEKWKLEAERAGVLKDLKYVIAEITIHPVKPYLMGNRELLDKMEPCIKSLYPEAVIVKWKGIQGIAVTDRQKKAMAVHIKVQCRKIEEELGLLRSALKEVEESLC